MTPDQVFKLTIRKVLEGADLASAIPIMKKIANDNKHLNFCISNLFDSYESGKIPIAVKDNMHIIGQPTTFASAITKNFIANVNASVIDKLAASCSPVMKVNLDQFAIGSTGKNSCFGAALSPWKVNGEHLCPGGSSSGSAVAVATGCVLGALGTETGGSVRWPAAVSGLFGYKPTYGLISRAFIGALCCAFDVVGVITKTAWDAEWMAERMYGVDPLDPTTAVYTPLSVQHNSFAVFDKIGESDEMNEWIQKCVRVLENAKWKSSFTKAPKILDYSIQAYVILNACDVASNLSRFNGILYGENGAFRNDIPFTEGVDTFKARTNMLGNEVKRRTVIGNAILYYENLVEPPGLYTKAQQVLCELEFQLEEMFSKYDFILLPVMFGRGPTNSEALNMSVLDVYKLDYYLVWSCMLGMPGITVPVGLSEEGVPLAVQIIGPAMSDKVLFQVAKILDDHFQFNEKYGGAFATSKGGKNV